MRSNQRDVIIEAGRYGGQYWKDLWHYRELFYFLAWRDILVRYKQTALGVAWSVLRPFLTMVVFTVIFGRLAKFPSDGVPYPVLVFAALLPWQFFSTGLTACNESLVGNAQMISKIYFPRLVLPITSVVVSVVDFLIAFTILVGLMIWYQYTPGWQIVTLPLFLIMTSAVTLGLGLWFSAFNVKYRDFRHIVPFLVQLGFYISPVGFSSNVIPDKWRMLFSLNPMVGVIDGFRWSLLGGQTGLYTPGIVMSLTVTAGILLSGILVFRKMEWTFADVI